MRGTVADDLNPPLPRRDFMVRSGAALLAAGLPATYQQLASAAIPLDPTPVLPVRTITAGVTIDPENPAAAVQRAGAFLQKVQELEGCDQPFPGGNRDCRLVRHLHHSQRVLGRAGFLDK